MYQTSAQALYCKQQMVWRPKNEANWTVCAVRYSKGPTSSLLHLCMFMGFSSSSSKALQRVRSLRNSR